MHDIPTIILTLKARIKDIDIEVSMLRQKQVGLEQALMIAEGMTSVVEKSKEPLY